MPFKIYLAIALISASLQAISQVKFSYLGQDLIKNISVVSENKIEENTTLTLKKGQILSSSSNEVSDFIIMKDYEFVYGQNEKLEEKIIALALKPTSFPSTSSDFKFSSYSVTDTTILNTINSIEKDKIYGDEAQLTLWNSKLTEEGKLLGNEVYEWKKKFIYQSRKESSFLLLGLVNNKIIDTLYKREVKIGSYNIDIKKISSGTEKGELSYKIIDSYGERIIDDPSKINQDSVKLEIPFIHEMKKLCPGASMTLYDANNKVVKTFYDKKLIKKGKYFERLKHTYFGYGTEEFTATLKNKKGDVLKSQTTTYNKINTEKRKNNGTISYLNLSLKYTSKKAEQRTKCTIENDEGEILAIVYENKNIHTGVNKIDYTFKHKLNEGEEVTIYVRNRPGRIIAQETYRIR